MKVELRYVADCSHVPATRALLQSCLAELGLPDKVTEMMGDYPSPSILIDNVDVIGGNEQGACCRLEAPTADQITAALRRAAHPILASRSARAANLPDSVRDLFRRILRHFALTGTTPTTAHLQAAATQAGVVDLSSALKTLSEVDLIAVDGDRLLAAYPFSPAPTVHRVRFGAVTAYSMCAIDALGVPYMLNADATILSVDPHNDEPVTVTVTGGYAEFSPTSAVVVYAATATAGKSVDTCCGTINFFTGLGSAHAWIQAHPHLSAQVLDQHAALHEGRRTFGALLD